MRSKMGSIINDISADRFSDSIISKAAFTECQPLR